MSQKKEPETDEEFYRPITKIYKRINSTRAIERYGKETEPEAGKGTKSRAIKTKDLRKIQLEMIAEIEKDIMVNARWAWKYGSALPHKDSKIQPLGDYPKKP